MRLQAQGARRSSSGSRPRARTRRRSSRSCGRPPTQAVKVDLALRAVAEAEAIDVDDDDLDAEFASVATRVGQKPAQVRKEFERSRQMPLVRSDMRKRKAFEWLIEHVEIVDEQGNPIDRSALEVDEEADDSDRRRASPARRAPTDTQTTMPIHGAADPQPELEPTQPIRAESTEDHE